MFFASPVGKQERDNLDFLKRHFLIPQPDEQIVLWEKAENEATIAKEDKKTIFEKARNWRGLALPNNAQKAADFIYWCLRQGILSAMMNNKTHSENYHKQNCQQEIKSSGVHDFWIKVADLLSVE